MEKELALYLGKFREFELVKPEHGKVFHQILLTQLNGYQLQVVHLERKRGEETRLIGIDHLTVYPWNVAYQHAIALLSELSVSQTECVISMGRLDRLVNYGPAKIVSPDKEHIRDTVNITKVRLVAKEILASDQCPENAKRLYSLLPGYPTDTRDCLLAQVQREYVLRSLGYADAADEIQRQIDHDWQGIKEFVGLE